MIYAGNPELLYGVVFVDPVQNVSIQESMVLNTLGRAQSAKIVKTLEIFLAEKSS